MRLTLRTLLAYLDEVLPAPQAEEIGKKLQESPMGNNLARRIQDVLRQRRLSSPTVSGPGIGIDPNAVAEYLDGTLSADGIASVERICLESDLHLAEVAGCHQILALCLEEPAELPPRICERMIALGPDSTKVMAPTDAAPSLSPGELSGQTVSAILAQAPGVDVSWPAAVGAAAPMPTKPGVAPVLAPASATSRFEEGLPDYLKTNRDKTRWWMYALATVVLAGWGFLTFRSSPFSSVTGDSAATATSVADELADAESPLPEIPSEGIEVAAAPMVPKVAATTDGTPDSAPPVEGPGLPDVENDPDLESPPYRKQTGRSNPKEAVGSTAPPGPTRTVAGKGKAVDSNQSAGTYTSSEGIALAYLGNDESWQVQPQGAAIPFGRAFAAPNPFESQITIPGVQLAVQPGSRLVFQAPVRGTTPTVDLKTGRLLIRPDTSDGSGNPTVAMHLTQATWVVTLSNDAVLGVEASRPMATRFEQRAGVDPGRGALHLASGRANVVHLGEREFAVELKGPATLELPVAVDDDGTARPAIATAWRNPDWMTPSKQTSSVRTAATLFARSFTRDEPVESSISGISKDSNPRVSELAAQALALTGNVPEMVKILKSNRHEEARRAAIVGLRTWLVSEEGDPDVLKEQLALRYTTLEAETVYELLWGYSRRDAQNKSKSAELLKRLSDPELSIRSLAIHHLKALTGQDFNFHPNATEQQRASSIRQWKHHLRNHGDCLIKPKGEASAEEKEEDEDAASTEGNL